MALEGTYYWLTPEYKRLLDELIEDRRRTDRRPHRETTEQPSPQAPETYVARTPVGGIPALTEVPGDDSEDIPGTAECRIYQIVHDYPHDPTNLPRLVYLQDLDRLVYNVHLDPVGGNRWVPVTRDKYGRWLALAIFPFPDVTDPTGEPGETGTGTGGIPSNTGTNCCDDDEEDHDLRIWPNSGTGTSPDTGGPGGVSYPCEPIYIEETDLFCEPLSDFHDLIATTNATIIGLGTGTGTGLPPGASTDYYLNLYKRKVFLNINRFTGCLQKLPGEWEYVRTVACCEPECALPDTGTNPANAECCSNGSLYARISYSLDGNTGPICTSCRLEGDLYQHESPDGRVYSNLLGGSTCGGRAFLDLTLYCANGAWRATGSLRRYLPNVEDTTETFDISVAVFGIDPSFLIGFIDSTCGSLTLYIENPCYHWECIDGICEDVYGDADAGSLFEWKTLAECQANCPVDVGTGTGSPGDTGVSNECCPGGMPLSLVGTITDKTGDWTTLPDSVTFTYSGGHWQISPDVFGNCDILDCVAGAPYFGVSAQAGWSCDPFMAIFLLDSSNCPGVGTGTCTLTVTE